MHRVHRQAQDCSEILRLQLVPAETDVERRLGSALATVLIVWLLHSPKKAQQGTCAWFGVAVSFKGRASSFHRGVHVGKLLVFAPQLEKHSSRRMIAFKISIHSILCQS